MQQIDQARLEADIAYRYQFLAEFIGFGEVDVAAIRVLVPQLAGRLRQIVDETYVKLLAYDATAIHFVPRQHGYTGNVPDDLADLTANHEQIQFRKEHLERYLMQLLGHAYDAKIATFLDMVGKMHTPKAGNKEIDVPLVQMNALMGLLSDILTRTIGELDVDAEKKLAGIRAFGKLMWLQNDFITRHYQTEPVVAA